MTANELREKFLKFFEAKGHKIIPSASLIPEHDPSVLFTTAGMHPLVPYLTGQKHPEGKRLANAQKCVRTSDIEEVGDNRHLTFFEMLGNWSLGDYFKEDAIKWSWEFLTGKEWLGLNQQRIYVTVFKGDGEVSRDEESIKIWQEVFKSVGIDAEVAGDDGVVSGNIRIIPLGKDDNFWISGETGPCGPDTEMFYDTQEGKAEGNFLDLVNSFRMMEIWNDVFMEFNKKADGSVEKLKQQNVDTGMGLERTISILNGKKDSFDNELFNLIFQKIEEISGKKYAAKQIPPTPPLSKGGEDGEALQKQGEEDNVRAFRIIADHLKAATFLLSEGLEPSNVQRGYVLRRLIRRAVRYGKQLEIEDNFTFKIAEVVIEIYRNVYQELEKNKKFIEEQLNREEEKFSKTIEKGLKELEKMKPKREEIPLPSVSSRSFMAEYGLSGDVLFDLYSTYGFPIEMSIEEIKKLYQEFNREQGVKITELPNDVEERLITQFHESLKKHQDLSRAASAGMFKGGLADASEATIKYHTAAHLMLAALRKILGEHVFQKGSNITAERLRFDFSHPQKMTPDEIGWVEKMVNEKIAQDLSVQMEEMTLEEAKEKGAMGVFESKYGERVRVYSISDFSKEICGGPHVEKTGQLGKFKIIKEESAGAGIRRIKAILE